jgi:hypothetical protein
VRKLRVVLLLLLSVSMCSAQDTIERGRVVQIQRALRKAGLSVSVNGTMDTPTMTALKRIAKSNHWQTQFVPDARVLISIGLGPKYKLMNPETAVRWDIEDTRVVSAAYYSK